jgi:hypothetical protein
MNVKAVTNYKGRLFKLTVFTILLAAVALSGWRWSRVSDNDLVTPALAQQQDIMLERRISQVEQRFYYIETRLNQLESQSRYPGTLPGASPISRTEIGQLRTELDTLRAQMDTLRSRVGEVECGLLRVDERTLTPAARQSRRQSAPGSSEPCRADPSAPVRLSVRP